MNALRNLAASLRQANTYDDAAEAWEQYEADKRSEEYAADFAGMVWEASPSPAAGRANR